MEHELKQVIAACDLAIREERFDDLMEYYTEEAVPVSYTHLDVYKRQVLILSVVGWANYKG